MTAHEIATPRPPGAARIAVGARGSEVEVCYKWDNGAERDSGCRVLRTGKGAYYLHRGTWPPADGLAEVYAIPTSVAIELRRLVAKESELQVAVEVRRQWDGAL